MNTVKNLRFTDTMHRPYNIQITISHLGKEEFSFKNIMRSGIKIHEKLFLIKKGAFLDVKVSRTKRVVIIPFLLCLFGLRKQYNVFTDKFLRLYLSKQQPLQLRNSVMSKK